MGRPEVSQYFDLATICVLYAFGSCTSGRGKQNHSKKPMQHRGVQTIGSYLGYSTAEPQMWLLCPCLWLQDLNIWAPRCFPLVRFDRHLFSLWGVLAGPTILGAHRLFDSSVWKLLVCFRVFKNRASSVSVALRCLDSWKYRISASQRFHLSCFRIYVWSPNICTHPGLNHNCRPRLLQAIQYFVVAWGRIKMSSFFVHGIGKAHRLFS